MKIILTGGGTGGHVLPAVAIAEKIYEKYPNAQILFIGREGGTENRSVTDAKIPLKVLKVMGIKRSLSPSNIKSVYLALSAVGKAKRIIREFKPDAVVGTGGYVCWPVLKAAHRLGIKTYIHESNVSPGLVTRLLSSSCDAVLLNHRETQKYLDEGVKRCVVGNPLRKSFLNLSREKARHTLGIEKNDIFIVSFGGSGGAKELNDAALNLMRIYSSKTAGIRHLHSTGQKYYDALPKEMRTNKSGGTKIVPYIKNMPEVLLASDIVICRAGAMTLSEIAAASACAILIPSPNVTDNHQYKNAELLSRDGAAILLKESDLTNESLYECVHSLVDNEKERKKMSKCIQRFANLHSAERIVEILTATFKKQ
ncbi:MAG: undecaprenyldiphospho-muramoylpentapeptide beta-N-acetylglucosaminyltransferase [Clostridia bacterium]|nr:undecaprenyldiphospho-muramoylpentapeptide beta-N-acetylglucosaminyltransferase [Clostridia bacterium]